MKLKNKLIVLFLGVATLFLGVSGVMAAEFKVADEEGESIVVAKGEKARNLYTGGNVVLIDGDIEKDLYAGGNTVTVNGNIEDDLFSGGSTIVVRGNVGGSVHAGGGNILIEGDVAEDLFLGGGNITLSERASVGGDLVVGAGTVKIEGPVSGNAYIGGGQVTLNGKIGGTVKVEADNLNIGKDAEIAKGLAYTSSEEAKVDKEAKVLGGVNFEKKEISKKKKAKSAKAFFGILSVGFLVKVLITIATGLVLVYLFGFFTKKVVRNSLAKFWPNVGIGFVVLILMPILAILLLVTVLGACLAVLVGVAYLILILLSSAIASISLGSWLMKFLKKQSKYSVDWQVVVLGGIVLSIVKVIPVVGWIVAFIFFLISLGAISQMIYEARGEKKA